MTMAELAHAFGMSTDEIAREMGVSRQATEHQGKILTPNVHKALDFFRKRNEDMLARDVRLARHRYKHRKNAIAEYLASFEEGAGSGG